MVGQALQQAIVLAAAGLQICARCPATLNCIREADRCVSFISVTRLSIIVLVVGLIADRC